MLEEKAKHCGRGRLRWVAVRDGGVLAFRSWKGLIQYEMAAF
jgi:hypothetical protein